MTKKSETASFTAIPLDRLDRECELIAAQFGRVMDRINHLIRSVGYYWFKSDIDATVAAEKINAVSNISAHHRAAVVAMAQSAMGLSWSDEKKTLYAHVDQKLPEAKWKIMRADDFDFRAYKKPQDPTAWDFVDHFAKLIEVADKKRNPKSRAKPKVAPVIPDAALAIAKRALAEMTALETAKAS
jgi:hypothetical protein